MNEENFLQEDVILDTDVSNDMPETDDEGLFETPSEEYGFEVENWEDDTYTTPEQIPNTVFDGKSTLSLAEQVGDIPLAAMSGISNGVKSILDAVTATGYGLTNVALQGKWETPTAKEMEEDQTLLPKSAIDYQPKTIPGAITKEVSRIGYGTAVATTGLGAAGITGKAGILTNATIKSISKSKDGIAVGKILAPMVNGIATDSLIFWQDEGNLSNLLQEKSSNPTIKKLADYLAIDDDDGFAERAAKQALEGVMITTAAHGIMSILKGVKNAAKYKKGLEEIKNVTSERIEEGVKSADEIQRAVSEGKMIEPRKETLELGEQSTKIQSPIVQETINNLQQEAKDMGLKAPIIPRNPEKIDAELVRAKVEEKWGNLIDIENPGDMAKYNQFLKESENQVEVVANALKVENDTINKGLIGLNAMKENAMKNGQVISDIEKHDAVRTLLDKLAIVRGEVEDRAYESAKALNTTSKDTLHKANKALLENIQKNIDEISTPEVFDVLSSAKTAEELQAKVDTLFNLVKSGYKKGNLTKKLVALEQAGLMDAADTLARNVYTSLENLSLGVIDDFAEATMSKIGLFATKNGAPTREYVDIFRKMGAYANYLKDSTLWMLRKSKDRTSPWRKYRDTVSQKLNTNLPKDVGNLFKDNPKMNAYIKFSGVNASEITDTFFEAGFYRGEASKRVQAQMRRLKKDFPNLTQKQIDKIGNTMLHNLTDLDTTALKYDIEDMNEAFFKQVERAVSAKSVSDATEMTFRSGQGAFTKGLTKAIDAVPFARIFAPFVKTSSTIIFDRFLHDRTPVGGLYELGRWGLSKLLPEQISSQLNNPALRSKFFAKQVVGGGVLTLGAYMYGNNMITGDYPSDPAQRKTWMAAGIQPNSLVLTAADGSKKYVSLNNMGIFTTLLRYPAKVAEYYKEQDKKLVGRQNKIEMDRRIMNDVVATSLAVGESLVDETILRNVSDFFMRVSKGFTDSEDIENFVVNVATNPAKNMVPRVFRQIMSNHEYKEVVENNYKSMKDLIDGSPIKYDVFGDPMEAPDFHPATIAGVKIQKTDKKEKYKYLMSTLEITVPGVNKTEMTVDGHSVRLTDEQVNKVYKKMGELGIGKSLEQIMDGVEKRTITEAERLAIQTSINKTYNRFKDAALKTLIIEDEDISKAFNDRMQTDIDAKMGLTQEVKPSLAPWAK